MPHNGRMDKEARWLLDEKYGGVKNDAFAEDLKRLAAGEPLAYVIGFQPFLGLRIHLDNHPLIPRPETEWWTERLLQELAGREILEPLRRPSGRAGGNSPAGEYSVFQNFPAREFAFLDLCAGSGAIGCAALSRLPHARVYFGELDPSYEETVRKNIRENGLDEARAEIRIGDLFAPFKGMRFDVIAANPPYVPYGRALDRSVEDYEPALALRAGPDGLDLIRGIAHGIRAHLAESGIAWIECDSAHAEAAQALLAAAGLRVQIRTDPYGAPRVLVVSFR